MEKIQIKDQLKEDYKKLIGAAQSIESAIGSAYCKLNKMVDVRQQVDTDLKTWWDNVSEEYKIDKTKDYYVDNDGAINVVEKKEDIADAPVEPLVDPDADVTTVTNEEAQAMVDSGEAKIPAEAIVEEVPVEDKDNKEGGTSADLT